MRKLFLLSGVSASGKSTFIKENNLEQYTVSSDKIRLLYSSPVFNEDGDLSISIKDNKTVWKNIHDILEYRFLEGHTTIFDAINLRMSNMKNIIDIAKKYSYRIYLVKIGYDLSEEELIKRDSLREQYKQVGSEVIKRQIRFRQELSIPSYITVLTPDEFLEELNWKIKDISNYSSIRVIGDIHNCATVLEEALSDFKEDQLYVFLGDYFDRGNKPVETMEILLRHIGKKNCVFLSGNHEKHILNFLSKNKIRSKEFKENTLPELLKAGYTEKDFRKLVKSLQPVYIAKFGNFNLLFSHAGFTSKQIGDINKFTNKLVLLSEQEFHQGIGGYQIDLEKEFSKKYIDLIQFHGHRNTYKHKVDEFSHGFIYNLEQNVDRGGKLGIADLKIEDDCLIIEDKSIQNDDFNKKSLLNDLRKHPTLIKEKKLSDKVSVFNFNQKVFYDKIWNDLTIQARGLFLNQEGEVVCRGYNKFFNIGERVDSTSKYIQSELIDKGFKNFIVSEKENGFLCLVAYIPELNKHNLSIFSKGAGEEFSLLAKETLLEYFKAKNIDYNKFVNKVIRDYNNNQKYTLVFEIINKDKDPHIVKYENNIIFLLDCIKNSVEGDFDNIKRDEFNKEFGIDIPKYDLKLINNFNNFFKEQFLRKDTEGVVILNLDTNKRFKIKTLEYNRKKELRKLFEILDNKNIDEQLFVLEKFMNKLGTKKTCLNKGIVMFLFNLLEQYKLEKMNFVIYKTNNKVDINKNIEQYNIKF